LSPEERVVAVLDLVDAIPPGRVMSYGDIAGYLGIPSARQVGRVMSLHGHEVPWQRVVMSDGRPAPHHERAQLAQLRADGTPIANGRVDMARARWCPEN
jgi:methylated-DNA-protein-cysteine methyltransferase related protein